MNRHIISQAAARILTAAAVMPAVILAVTAVTPAAAQQYAEITTPGAVSVNTEPPRGIIVSYNSRDLAFRRDAEGSAYMQYLDGEWKVRRFGDPGDADHALAMPSADPGSWETVKLPDTGAGNAAAIYRTEFKVPQSLPNSWDGRQIFMHIGPVGRSYYIYVNGQLVGYHEDSRSSAEYDITRYAQMGQRNYLAIVAYGSPASAKLEDQTPTVGTFLADEVYVIAQPRVRVRDWIVETRLAPNGTDGLVNFGVMVKTHLLNTRQVTVHYDLYDPSGALVYNEKKDASFGMRGEDTVRFAATIPAVETCSNESPALYTAFIRVQHEGRYTEYMTQRVGFRDLRFSDGGLTLNGTPLTLNAVNYTPAQDSAAIARDFTALREKGVNMVRVESYPQRQLFYDMADIFGMYVCDQANIDSHNSGGSLETGGTPANDPLWEGAHLERVMNMYHFSRNHPSVVMYSLGGDAGRGYNMYESYLALKRKETVRPVVYEGAGAEWNSDIVIGDVPSRNDTDTRSSLSFMPWETAAALPGMGAGTAVAAGATGRTGAPRAGAAATGNTPRPQVSIEPVADSPTQFRLVNGIANTALSNFDVEYNISRVSRKLATGIVPADIPAGATGMVTIPVDGLRSGEYTLTVNIREKHGTPWRAKGDVLTSVATAIRIP